MKITELFDAKLLKFLLVGILNTCVGAGVMFILYNCANLSYWISSICNYIVGGILSYFLNKYFTFNNKQKSIKQIILFIVNLLLCYLIAYIFAKWIIYKLFASYSISVKDNISMFVGMCLYTGLNYLTQRLIIFKDGKQK